MGADVKASYGFQISLVDESSDSSGAESMFGADD